MQALKTKQNKAKQNNPTWEPKSTALWKAAALFIHCLSVSYMSRMKYDHMFPLTFPRQHPGILPMHVLLSAVFLLLFSLSFTLNSYILELLPMRAACIYCVEPSSWSPRNLLAAPLPKDGESSHPRACQLPAPHSVRGGVPLASPQLISSFQPPLSHAGRM